MVTSIEQDVQVLRARIEVVNEKIEQAARRTGRSSDAVRLVVVTKAHPVERVHAAIAAGAKIIGENYAAEASAKAQSTPADLRAAARWDMIGHVQSRKAREVALNFDYFQALDSVKLAGRLDRFLAEQSKELPVLVQVNVSGEAAKFGLPAWKSEHLSALLENLDAIDRLKQLKLQGLMTLPPFLSDPEAVRPYFVRLRELQEMLKTERPDIGLQELSMGMSGDYEAAVEEGATIVRVGTAIMGSRPPKE